MILIFREPEFEGLDEVVIEFSVFDGKFTTTATVQYVFDDNNRYDFYSIFLSVRLIDFNVAPVITLSQNELFYTEGNLPSFLPGGIVNITDVNDVNMTG